MNAVRISEYRRKERERADVRPIRVLCAWCGWESEGTLKQCRERALAHREKKHPERKAKRRVTRNLGGFVSAPLHSEQKQEIQADREKRAKLLGVKLDD